MLYIALNATQLLLYKTFLKRAAFAKNISRSLLLSLKLTHSLLPNVVYGPTL